MSRAFLAIDIENGGSEIWRPLFAIGVCVGDGTLANVSRQTFCAAEHVAAIEPRCQSEFWDKYPLIMERIQKEGKDITTAKMMQQFCEFLNGLEAKYDSITILTDNASFDLLHIDSRLDKYCDRAPMRYTTKGKYRSVEDPSEMLRMLPKTERIKIHKQIAEIVEHNHWPENDAYNIYIQYLVAQEYKAAIAVGSILPRAEDSLTLLREPLEKKGL